MQFVITACDGDCDAILTIIPRGSAQSPGTQIGLDEGKTLSKPMYTASGIEDAPDIIRWIDSLPDEGQEAEDRGVRKLTLHASALGRKAYIKSGYCKTDVLMEKVL